MTTRRPPAAALGTNPAAALYRPATQTHHADAWDMTFRATCPADGCDAVITWTDSPTAGPRPGPCDCDIERNAA